MANLYDQNGEEKAITFDQIQKELRAYHHQYSIEMPDQKQLICCLTELQFYNFVDIKAQKLKNIDAKKQSYLLKVDLNELINELDCHPTLKSMKEAREAKNSAENSKKTSPSKKDSVKAEPEVKDTIEPIIPIEVNRLNYSSEATMPSRYSNNKINAD